MATPPARAHSPTLVPEHFDLDTWRRAAAWALSEPPAPAADALPTGTQVTPLHLRLAELLVAHQLQQDRVVTLERQLRRARWGLLATGLLGLGSGVLGAAGLIAAVVL